MKLLEKVGSAVKKAALATVALGGFLGFAGAGMASAHPRVVVGVGIGGPVVVRGYLAQPTLRQGPTMGRFTRDRGMDLRITAGSTSAIGMRGFTAGASGKESKLRKAKSAGARAPADGMKWLPETVKTE